MCVCVCEGRGGRVKPQHRPEAKVEGERMNLSLVGGLQGSVPG